jgi:hypothetical protein
MPRYHFNVEDGASYRDKEGLTLPDLAMARKVAVEMISDFLDGHPDAFWDGREWKLEVTDEQGLILFVLTFAASNAPVLQGLHPSERT